MPRPEHEWKQRAELFTKASWLAVMVGQGLIASGHDPLARAMPLDEIRARLARIAAVTQAATGHMPAHADFIAPLFGPELIRAGRRRSVRPRG